MVALSAKLTNQSNLKSKNGQKNSKISSQNAQPHPIVSKNQTSVLPLTVYSKNLDLWTAHKLYNLDALLSPPEISQSKFSRGIKFVNLNLLTLIIRHNTTYFLINLTINHNLSSKKTPTPSPSPPALQPSGLRDPSLTIYDEL